MSEDSEIELREYLQLAAAEAEVSVTELLYRVLHLDSNRKAGRFLQFFTNMDEPTRALLVKLDYHLRVLNPGLHYVYRAEHLGYRREDTSSRERQGQRSQIFVSVLRRSRALQLIVPLNPRDYENIPGCRDVGSIGHHGVGDMQVDISDTGDLESFFTAFETWLRPSTGIGVLFLRNSQAVVC
jgi:hypothetical protein